MRTTSLTLSSLPFSSLPFSSLKLTGPSRTLRRFTAGGLYLSVVLGSAVALAAPAHAASPPGNDSLANAITLTSGTAVQATSVGATREADERGAYHAATRNGSPVYSCFGGASTWYSIPAGTSHTDVTVTDATVDTAVTLWSQATRSDTYVGDLSGVNGLRTGPGSGPVSFSADTDPAQSYYIAFDACNTKGSNPVPSAQQGTGTLAASFYTPPANDDHSAPQAVTGEAGTVAGSTYGARRDARESCRSNGRHGNGKGIWYRFTAPSHGTYRFDTTGSAFNTILCIGPAATNLTDFADTAGNDDTAPGSTTSAVLLSAAAGGPYDVYIEGSDPGDGTAAGSVVLNWKHLPDTTAPQASITSPAPGGQAIVGTGLPVTVHATDDDSGIAAVTLTLADSPTQTVTAGSNGDYTAVFATTGKAPGAYTLTATATDNAGNTIQPATQSIVIAAAPTPLPAPAPVRSVPAPVTGTAIPAGYTGPGTVSLTGSPAVHQHGFTTTSTIARRRGAIGSARKGSTITLHFVGSRLDLHFDATNAGGRARITIDGKTYVVDLYSAHAHDYLSALRHLTAGTHTVTVLGQKARASRGTRVVLSLVRVYA